VKNPRGRSLQRASKSCSGAACRLGTERYRAALCLNGGLVYRTETDYCCATTAEHWCSAICHGSCILVRSWIRDTGLCGPVLGMCVPGSVTNLTSPGMQIRTGRSLHTPLPWVSFPLNLVLWCYSTWWLLFGPACPVYVFIDISKRCDVKLLQYSSFLFFLMVKSSSQSEKKETNALVTESEKWHWEWEFVTLGTKIWIYFNKQTNSKII